MRITFITSKFNFETGGGSGFELDLKIRALSELGHQVTAVTLFSQDNKFEYVPYTICSEYIKSKRLFSIQRGVYHALKKYEKNTDIFHIEGQFAYGAGWYKRNLFSRPVVVHFNRELSSFPETRKATQKFKKISLIKQKGRFILEKIFGTPLINRSQLFTFTSPILKNVYINFGLDDTKTLVVPDFCDTNAILGGEIIFSSDKKTDDPITIFSTGRMISEKGFDVLIRAFSHLPNRERFRLIVSGDGPDRAKLIQLANELGIEKNVSFPGWVEDKTLEKLFKQADIFVIPRWRPELTSMLLLKSMAMGVPTIVTKGTALDWQSAGSALVFKDEDHSDLVRCIMEFADNEPLRNEFRAKGYERARALDYRNIVVYLEKALEDVIKENSAQRQTKIL